MLTKEGVRSLVFATICSGVVGVLTAAAVLFAFILPVIGPAVAMILGVILDLLILFALVGIFGVQYPQIGFIGLFGFSIAFVGTVISIPFSVLGNIILAFGLCLLAIASSAKGTIPSVGLWLWWIGVLVGITGGLLNPLFLLPTGLLLAAAGRLVIGLEMKNVYKAADDVLVPA